MDLNKEIEEKIKKLNQLVQEIQKREQELVEFRKEALRIDGAISVLKEINGRDKGN